MTSLSQPVSIRIIADDFTGACDAAVAFACVGMVTEVEPSWDSREPSDVQVVAFNTESRDISPTESTARMKQVVEYLEDGAHQIFKKIDSVFRGNSYREIASIVASMPHDLAILAPAYPELDRTIIGGELHYRDVSGEHAISILRELQSVGVNPKIVAAGARIVPGDELVLCDSHTQQDLRHVVEAALALPCVRRILWIGSGGLAHALAASLGRSSIESPTAITGDKVLFVVGSDHPVTLQQLEHLKRREPEAIVLPIPRGITESALRQRIDPFLSQGIPCLFATGGDTALAVCRAFKIRRLRVESEFARGLPQSRIVGGLLHGMTFLLKSGGFGDEDVLFRIAENLASKEMRSAR
jgi:uncharacterized protein YgbK (DUF1537 family)